jgi:hypothetical protein
MLLPSFFSSVFSEKIEQAHAGPAYKLREGMETLDENLFDLLLSFLTPREAVCLGGVSKSLRVLSEGSLRWKEWCE